MSRVKFNVNSEYAYIQNFKVLQSEPHPCNPSPVTGMATDTMFVQTRLPSIASTR